MVVKMLVLLVWAGSAAASGDSKANKDDTKSSRQSKALNFYRPYLEDPQVVLNNVASEFDYSDPLDFNRENEVLSSRSRPSRPKQDSPVYYIRLPPSPYMLVPGMGYISRPPQLRPPPVVQPRPQSQLFNLPLNFVSNEQSSAPGQNRHPVWPFSIIKDDKMAKPSGIYTWKQDSPITNLNKGPYTFNGRPSDIFLLRNPFNALYDNTIHNNFFR